MRELALFAGGGGGILGGYLLGWRTVCAVEIGNYPRRILLARQRDGILPPFPIWDDIKTFDGAPWKGRIDIITGGFPCQDISIAGKGKGIEGERSGLWKEMRRVVCEVGPRFVYVENSSALTFRGLGVVLRDLAQMGYNARWCVLGADDSGAPHRRKRIWILAYTDQIRRKKGEEQKQVKNQAGRSRFDRMRVEWWDIDPADLPDTGCKYGDKRNRERMEEDEKKRSSFFLFDQSGSKGQEWKRPVKSRVGRVVNGLVHRVDRLKAIGNGQVPAVAALAFLILSEGLI